MAESEEELKILLMKEESEKVGLKLNIQKTKFMASGPMTSWQIDGETMETVTEFNLGCSKITAGGDCSHEIKRCLLLGRKAMTILNSILGEKNTQKRGAKIEPGVSLLFASFGSACPHVWRMYFPFLANKTEL